MKAAVGDKDDYDMFKLKDTQSWIYSFRCKLLRALRVSTSFH